MSVQTSSSVSFLSLNLRWLVGGLLLTFCSSFGQTFFISLFAADVRLEFGLTHGEFGGLYMLATMASAATLVGLGRVLDTASIFVLARRWLILLAAAALLMALSTSIVVLFAALFMLRLFGQGMLTHTAIVAMGRWFSDSRGKAVAIVSAGHQIGEAALPMSVLAASLVFDWRLIWLICACVLLGFGIPAAHFTLRGRPTDEFSDDSYQPATGRQWTCSEAMRDAPFWIICCAVIAPAFIGTSVFFHQVHLAEIKQWPGLTVAGSFTLMSVTTVITGLAAGYLIDRFRASQVLPIFLLPLAAACLVLSLGKEPVTMFVFMCLLGFSTGFSNTVFGAIWPEIYGIRHLGAIRAVVSAAMVFSSALGPGVTGWLIDRGVGFEYQLLFMGSYALLTLALIIPVVIILRNRHLHRRGFPL